MAATVYCHGVPTGQTLTATAYPDGSDTAALSGGTAIEATNRKGSYSFSTTLTGLHLIHLKSGSNVFWFGWAVLAASGTIEASDSRDQARNLASLVDGKTLPEALQIIGATTAGKISGAGSGTETFLGLDGATTRVVSVVDTDGNRSSETYP